MAQAGRLHGTIAGQRIFGMPVSEFLRRAAVNAAVFAFCLLSGRAAVYPQIAPFGMAALCAGLLSGKKIPAVFFGTMVGMLLSGRPVSAVACVPIIAVFAFYKYIGAREKSFAANLGARRAIGLMASTSLALCSLLWGTLAGFVPADILSIPVSAVLCCLLVPLYEKTGEIIYSGAVTGNAAGDSNTPGVISVHDLVAAALPLGALLLGMADITPFGRVPAVFIASALCAFVAYACGAGAGAAVGAIVGAVLSAGTPLLPSMSGTMALCGLCVGAFRSLGKGGSICAFLSAALFSFWQGGISILAPPWPEIFLSAAAFAAIPAAWQEKFSALIDGISRANKEIYQSAQSIRTGAMLKLNRLLPVFASMQRAYSERENAPIDLQSVCAGCKNEALCHGKYSMRTVKMFNAAITGVIDDEFKSFCARWEDIREQIMLARMQRECSKMIGRQIKAIGEMIGNVARSFGKEYAPETQLTGKISLAISDTGEVDVFSVNASREEGLVRVDVACSSCGGCRRCETVIAPVISECAGTAMQCVNYGCISKGGVCRLHYEPVEKLNVVIGVSRRAPCGEKSCGDSYTFGRLDGGRFYVALSDGMGSGPDANELSQRTITLVEDYLAAGLEPALAAETANRYMSSVARGKERYATLDLHCFSLFDGNMEYVKVGACHSYILSQGGMKVLGDSSLPLGIFDELSLSAKKASVASGDVLIVISDGISDCAREDSDRWMDSIRGGISKHNPQLAAEYILRKSQEKEGMDDRTVLVIRIT